MSDTDSETLEQALDKIVAEKGGGIVGLVKRGDFSRYFCMTIERDLDEQFLRKVFADAGKHLAISLRLHNEKANVKVRVSE